MSPCPSAPSTSPRKAPSVASRSSGWARSATRRPTRSPGSRPRMSRAAPEAYSSIPSGEWRASRSRLPSASAWILRASSRRPRSRACRRAWAAARAAISDVVGPRADHVGDAGRQRGRHLHRRGVGRHDQDDGGLPPRGSASHVIARRIRVHGAGPQDDIPVAVPHLDLRVQGVDGARRLQARAPEPPLADGSAAGGCRTRRERGAERGAAESGGWAPGTKMIGRPRPNP